MPPFNVSRDHSGEAWFRIGRFEITTTVLIVGLGAIGSIVATLVPVVFRELYFDAQLLLSGNVWRVLTWPFVSILSPWAALSLAMLWYFGRDLERQIGRRAMASLYIGMWASLTAITTVVWLANGSGRLAGLGLVQFIVLLLWIAEYPQRPFFFGIKAWVLGAIYLGLQLVLLLASSQFSSLITLVGALAFSAVFARRAGLLSEWAVVPGRRRSRVPRVPRSEQRAAQRRASDAERIDDLLEKISGQGIHSLTASERRELEKLRQRRQRK